ncbi:hypothetical protein EFO43_12250 [Lactococcus cremoris]|uniref:hypothetical protein n=1 Tax=Lactococcus lactis subsp. cremoris TaxID=1359 RepID=UPI0021AA5767|nr:hypothetical protein [Lactococcus cremoris]MCT4416323.1 hypothetical protein [Lactococcus cremoris]
MMFNYLATTVMPIFLPSDSTDKISSSDGKNMAWMIILLFVSAIIGAVIGKIKGGDFEDAAMGSVVGVLVFTICGLLVLAISALL